LTARLKARLSLEHPVFSLTWKKKATPSGRVVSRLQVSARSTSGRDCGSWQSPRGQISGDTAETHEQRQIRVIAKHGRRMGTPIEVQAQWMIPPAQLATWPTPTAQDQIGSGVKDYPATATHHSGTTLTDAANLATWATPQACDSRGSADAEPRKFHELPNQTTLTSGPMSSGSPVATAKRGQLNPALSRWLCGYPVSWCQAAIRAHRTRTRLQKRGSVA
jgi:hypothetical protein